MARGDIECVTSPCGELYCAAAWTELLPKLIKRKYIFFLKKPLVLFFLFPKHGNATQFCEKTTTSIKIISLATAHFLLLLCPFRGFRGHQPKEADCVCNTKNGWKHLKLELVENLSAERVATTRRSHWKTSLSPELLPCMSLFLSLPDFFLRFNSHGFPLVLTSYWFTCVFSFLSLLPDIYLSLLNDNISLIHRRREPILFFLFWPAVFPIFCPASVLPLKIFR